MTWSHTHCTYHCSNVQYSQCYSQDVPSVLWHCWLGGRKGIRPVKTEWWGAGMVVCLERGADLHTAQLMPLPLTVSCFSKIRIGFTFLVLGSPGKRAVKQVCVCVCVCYSPDGNSDTVRSLKNWSLPAGHGGCDDKTPSLLHSTLTKSIFNHHLFN